MVRKIWQTAVASLALGTAVAVAAPGVAGATSYPPGPPSVQLKVSDLGQVTADVKKPQSVTVELYGAGQGHHTVISLVGPVLTLTGGSHTTPVTLTDPFGATSKLGSAKAKAEGAHSTTIGTATADSNGNAVTTATIPSGTAPGVYELVATDPVTGTTETTLLTVPAAAGAAAGAASGGSLTGALSSAVSSVSGHHAAQTTLLVGAGALAAAASGLLFLSGRRRQRRAF